MVTRRKGRRFGIWINMDYRQFLQVRAISRCSRTARSTPSASPDGGAAAAARLNNVLPHAARRPDYADVVSERPRSAARSCG